MAVYFITRHPGAVTWARDEGIVANHVTDHLDVTTIQPGDTVIGTLPVNLAAQVCARGASYLHLSLELPPDMRGKELTAQDMQRLGARLEAFHVQEITG